MKKTNIPILFCIDIEPDERKLDPCARVEWLGFEQSFEFFNQLRRRLESATQSPVHFSWFMRMDPQIAHIYGSADWAVTRYRHLIEELEAAGDEIGLHAHANRWDENSQDWIADYANQEWIDHCVRSSFEAFQTALNRHCRSFRFGDHWMNDRTMDLLASLGTRFDLTTEFMASTPELADEPFTGYFPDYTRIPKVPYRPRKNDFKKRSRWPPKDGLWIIPVSAGNTQPAITRQVPWKKFLSSRQHSQEFMSLILAFNPHNFSMIGDRLLKTPREPYLVLPARTDMVSDPHQRNSLDQNIEYLLSHPLVERFVCDTPAEAITRLRFDPLRRLKTKNSLSNLR